MKEKKIIAGIAVLLLLNICVLSVMYQKELQEIIGYVPGINRLFDIITGNDEEEPKGLQVGDERQESITIPYEEIEQAKEGNKEPQKEQNGEEQKKEEENTPPSPEGGLHPQEEDEAGKWGPIF